MITLSILAVISFAITGITFFWMHFNRDYHIHTYAVSDFIHTRHAPKLWTVMTSNGLGYAFLGVAFLLAHHYAVGVVSLIASVFSILIAAVPVNPIGTPRNVCAYMHIGVAGIFFTLVFLLMTLTHIYVTPVMGTTAQAILGIILWISRISLVAFLIISLCFGERFYGIPQRSFIVSSFFWSSALSICILANSNNIVVG